MIVQIDDETIVVFELARFPTTRHLDNKIKEKKEKFYGVDFVSGFKKSTEKKLLKKKGSVQKFKVVHYAFYLFNEGSDAKSADYRTLHLKECKVIRNYTQQLISREKEVEERLG